MEQSTIWWLLAGIAIGIELITGTFYLLMLAVALSSAAVAAHINASLTAQIATAAVMGTGFVLAWRKYQQLMMPNRAPANSDRNVNLDIGETVQVDSWNADGTTTVKYRGAQWAASCAVQSPLDTGPHQIVEVIGSRLVLQKTSSNT